MNRYTNFNIVNNFLEKYDSYIECQILHFDDERIDLTSKLIPNEARSLSYEQRNKELLLNQV
ncbi:hypothetical protein BpHYR1_009943 [Brachionus plicatilis]|uniref:Uncharacterized protein n=1 Tax=Brachionus plicatilis TaxID=10195 RepID=A0A3M7RSU5_BRAPC|nr:hypothetical protein BpHYR1_009943 [Brachionus plicatilis]